MNKKLVPAVTFGLAVLLVGSIAYAADRRKNSKSKYQPVNDIQEEETLRAGLLGEAEHRVKKSPETDEDTRLADLMADADNNITAASAKIDK